MQHVEQVVLHQRLDHQLVQVMLRHTNGHVDQTPHKTQDTRDLTCGLYLHRDLELVQRADVLHQDRDDELMGDTL